MNYSNDPSICRVDFFKNNGKWYATEAISFDGLYDEQFIEDAFRTALTRHLKGRYQEMWAVCLEPYHRHAFPQMVIV